MPELSVRVQNRREEVEREKKRDYKMTVCMQSSIYCMHEDSAAAESLLPLVGR